MRTLQQILREFWLPLLAAMCWTAYVLWSMPIDLKAVISAFGPAFFLASWMTGQFFRIRKQEYVQSGLSSVETRLQSLVEQLEMHAKEITHYTTGGDSYCYFGVGVNGNTATWTVVHQGKYPLYNVGARIVDLSQFQAAMNSGNPFAADTNLRIGDIGQSQAAQVHSMDLGSGNARDFNVFFSARNGFYTQLLRFRRVNGKWLSATSVTFMAPAFQTNPALHKVDHGYPLDAHGKPDGI
jgi:hypothetical protein